MDKRTWVIFFIVIGVGLLSLLLFRTHLKFSLVFLLGIFIILLTFIRADLGLIFLILSMLLSPELKVGEVPGRNIVIRLDDILIGVVFLSWIARMAVYKELGVFRHTPLNRPIGIYASLCTLFTLFGVMRGDVQLASGFFYLLKYTEYFLIYFMAVNILKEKSQLNLYLLFLFITSGIVCIYASAHIGRIARLSAPFEGAGEPNTLGGYLIIIGALAMGVLAYISGARMKLLLCGFVGLVLVCIAYSLSRCTYIAFPFMYFTMLAFSRKKKGFIIGLILLVAAFIIFKPEFVINRIKYTFQGEISETSEKIFGIPVDPSASARLSSWKMTLKEIWETNPLLAIIGAGTTGRGFLDGQYAKVLIELGVVGFIAFIYLLYSMVKECIDVYKKLPLSGEPAGLYKGIALGALGALAGVYIHAITANSFIIIRIQEPLWFLLAIIVTLPEIVEGKSEKGNGYEADYQGLEAFPTIVGGTS